MKAPAKKTAPRKTAAKKTSAPKGAKPATSKAAKPAASKAAKPAASKAARPAASKAAPRKAPRKPAAEPAPREPLPEIPAELLAASPRAQKPRKPRGKKAAAEKPAGALDTILAQLDDAKAEQIVTIRLDDKSAVADAMVVASGRSNRHVGAIADQLVQKLKEKGYRDLRIEGMPQCDWVLVDAGDVVVHIFRPEVRSFYNLEKLWSAHAPDDRIAM
ncbi:MAG: ribosome silencing factor [Aestuariivirga sp.]|nr:ribosome silencing factor [Aestuariivirga sp.]